MWMYITANPQIHFTVPELAGKVQSVSYSDAHWNTVKEKVEMYELSDRQYMLTTKFVDILEMEILTINTSSNQVATTHKRGAIITD